MRSKAPNLELVLILLFGALFPLFLCASEAVQAETIVFHLKNGDRIAGRIVSEDTNRVVITTSWIKELPLPVDQIERREKAATEAHVPKDAPASTAVVAAQKPSTPSASTNGAPNPLSPIPVVSVPSTPSKTPKGKHWKAEARIGADFLLGAKEQQIYYGRFKLSYQRPYASHPKQFFRNIFDYSVDYGRTEGIMSANRMDASDKTDVDVGQHKWFVYNLAGVGYDEIRKIDLRYEVGPGVGYHLFTMTNLVVNLEAGVDYQTQYRADNTTSENFYYRFAQDLTWKLGKQLTLTEKFEYFPQVDISNYRARFEATLSYAIWQSVSLNLTLIDRYDSQPASNVPNNELQLRSSVGVTF